MPHADLAELPVEQTGLGSYVRIRNTSTSGWVDKFDNRRYVIPAGSEVMVPYEAAVLWLGDPDSRDIDARHRNRTDEWFRLRVRYGVYDREHEFGEHGPQLECYSLDGKRVVTVADDPYLERFGEMRNGGVSSEDALAALTRQVEALQQQLAQQQFAPTPPALAPVELLAGTEATEVPPVPAPVGETPLPKDEASNTAPPADLAPVPAPETIVKDEPRRPKVRQGG